MGIQREGREDVVSYRHEQHGYTLRLSLLAKKYHRGMLPTDIAFLVKAASGKPIMITGRDMNHYPASIRDFDLPHDSQTYIVGAGLGALAPALATCAAEGPVKKPVVIDPAEYAVMYELLEAAAKDSFGSPFDEKIVTLLSRCEEYLDDSRIVVVNKRLGDVIKNHPEHHYRADVLVDSFATSNYARTEGAAIDGRKIAAWHVRLLKPGGVLLPQG